MNKKVYYNQADSRWANHKYTSRTHPNANLKSSGCGPTALAMLVSSLTDITIKPNQMADALKINGYRANEGTSMDACKFVANTYNLNIKKVDSDDLLISYLANGHVAVVSVYGGSVFSTVGHVVFLCGYENGKIQVHDPYLYKNKFNAYGRSGKVTVSGNDVWITSENWRKYAKSNVKYVFEIPQNKAIDTKFKAGQRCLVDIPVQIAYDSNEDCIVDSNGYQFWIHKSIINNQNHVYGLADICYAQGDGLYIVQIFDKQFWCKEEYMKNV